MICPFCKAENATSTLTPDMYSTSTCMASSPGSYDELGGWTPGPDPNWYTRGYTCSRGHRYTISTHAGSPDEVRLVSPITTTDHAAGSVVLAVDRSRSNP